MLRYMKPRAEDVIWESVDPGMSHKKGCPNANLTTKIKKSTLPGGDIMRHGRVRGAAKTLTSITTNKTHPQTMAEAKRL